MPERPPSGAWAAQFTLERFGCVVDVVESNPTATTTPQNFLKNNPRRIGFMVFNLGTSNVFMGRTPSVSATNGFPIQALGGGVSSQVDEDGEIPAREWFLVSASSTDLLYIVEIVGLSLAEDR